MSKTGEIIQIHIGQAGVQVANACWELYCLEHGIMANGCKTIRDDSFNTFFSCSADGRVTPRLIMVDLEPTVIDEIRSGAYRKLFSPESLITGKEDSGSNYSRAYFTLGSEMIDYTMNRVRMLAENCENLQGFMVFRSLGGGTGSGFGNLILEKLLDDYGRKSKLEFDIFPSPNISPLVVEPYNSILAAHNSIETTDCCFLIDNEALYDICSNKLDVQSPTYTNLNRLVGQAVSAFTASQRFQSDINVSFSELQTNLIPYPRLHFTVLSYAPIVSVCRSQLSNYSIREITLGSFEPSNQLVKCSPMDGKYMSCVLLYRGDVSPTDINQSIYDIKSRRGIQFVEWSPTGFKIGVNYMPPIYVPGGDLAPTNKAVCMASNTTSIRKPLCRIIDKFSKMLQRRAFVHHYIGEGLEESTIVDACEDLCSLVGDYTEVSSDAVNDGDDDGGDY